MFSLSALKPMATKIIGRSGLILRHYSPEICTTVGIITGVVGAVFACKATLKVEGIVDYARSNIDNIKASRETLPDKYSEADSRKDLTIVYARTAGDLVKLYALPAGLGLLSIAFVIGGHRILRRENAIVTGAYMALSESFKKYRQRVRADVGEEKEREYHLGVTKEEIEVTDENGVVTKKTVKVSDPSAASVYARYFNERNPNFSTNPELNLMFLRKQQSWANDRLHADGHLFLNDVYSMLGIPKTEAGQIVGWITGCGDNFVDFGLYAIDSMDAQDFINGYTQKILLDFNVDGPILQIFSKLFGEELADKLVYENYDMRPMLKERHRRKR